MVMARLHLICGNCGCDDEWEWEHDQEARDNGDGTFGPDVWITCRNCSTLHTLSSKAKQRPKHT